MTNRHLFSYESLQNLKDRHWKLALNIPLHGEELIDLDWRDAFKSRVGIEGSFYRRLRAEAFRSKGGRSNLRLLNSFITRWGQVMEAQRQSIEDKGSWSCGPITKEGISLSGSCQLSPTISMNWVQKDGHFIVTVPLDSKRDFVMNSFDLDKGHYNRMSLYVTKRNENSQKKIIKLDLFLKSCTI